MKGITYLVDNAGNKTGVVLDLKKHRRLWEEIHDRLLIESRRGEPRLSLEQLRGQMTRRTTKAHG